MSVHIKIRRKSEDGSRKVTYKGQLVGYIVPSQKQFLLYDVYLPHKDKVIQSLSMLDASKVFKQYDWHTIVGWHWNGMPHPHFQPKKENVHHARWSRR